MKRFCLALSVVVAALLVLSSARKTTTIFIIGDSTAANKRNYQTYPERGWGMMLQGCFDERILIDNHAVNGQSSKTFIDGGRWQKVLDRIKPGDYVIIQFGHNDEKPNPQRHTDPGTTFDANLRKFVQETRAKGGNPVLMNAVVRRNFYQKVDNSIDDESLRDSKYSDEKVNSDTLVDTHGAYLISPRTVAREQGVPFVDANKITHDIEQSMGIEGSRRLHIWLKPGELASAPDGRKDNTHYCVYGARIVANALADALGEQVPALKKHVRHYDYVVSAKGRGDFLSLQEAVDAVARTGKKARIIVLDGKWEKPKMPKGHKIKIVKCWDASVQ